MTRIIENEERWLEIFDFPGYAISDRGNVLNQKTGLQLRVSAKPQGLRMVGLMKSGIQHKRSLPLLVARAYLSRPDNEAFDTPIHLDGDHSNCTYSNLMWRPKWYARRYMAQFDDNHSTITTPIEDVETGEIYESSMHASIVNGLLDEQLIRSMHEEIYIWPTGQVFRRAR